MYGRDGLGAVDRSAFRLTRLRVVALAGLFLSIALGVSFYQFGSAKNLVLPSGGFVGGDFLAFYTAATAAEAGDAASVYDPALFEAQIQAIAPPKDRYGLTWQYPPTYFLFVLPLALLAYAPAYVLWTGGSAAAWLATMRAVGLRDAFLFVVAACPSAFHAVITGQNGFFTATLLAFAALFADRRPVVAGLAAALLTVKPQLGVLVPLAFAASGSWRAFAVASAGALVLAAASVVAFGPDVWIAFREGIAGASDHLASGLFPLFKMATPYAAARLAGLPVEVAAGFHLICAGAAAAFVMLVWRRLKDAELRAAALIASVFLAAPYGYYYELIILALPVALIAKRAHDRGWLPYEQLSMVGAFLLPLMIPGESRRLGVSFGFVLVLLVFGIVARRVAHECPGALPFVRPRRA